MYEVWEQESSQMCENIVESLNNLPVHSSE